MEEKILYDIFVKDGWQILVVSMLTIFIVGVLKFFKLFDKINKDKRKPIYLALNSVIAIGLAAIFNALIGDKCGTAYAINFVSVVVATNALYAVYENVGLRDLVRSFGRFIVNNIAKDKVKEQVMQIVGQLIKDDSGIEEAIDEAAEKAKEAPNLEDIIKAENEVSQAENEKIAKEDEKVDYTLQGHPDPVGERGEPGINHFDNPVDNAGIAPPSDTSGADNVSPPEQGVEPDSIKSKPTESEWLGGKM